MSEDMRAVSDASFDAEVLSASRPVLVDFWAPWCGPCRQLAPVLAAIAAELGDKVDVVKVDIDENPEVTQRFGISSIPTLHLFRDGEVVYSTVGAKPKRALLDDITSHL